MHDWPFSWFGTDKIKTPKTHLHDCPFSWFGTETKLKPLKHTYMTAHSPGLAQALQ